MTITEFIQLITLNRHLLGEPEQRSYTKELSNNYYFRPKCSKGCPLRIAMTVSCTIYDYWRLLFNEKAVPTNPSARMASTELGMDIVFTRALVYGWDFGEFYNDNEGTDFYYEFSGFLLGFTLRRPRPQLTEGT